MDDSDADAAGRAPPDEGDEWPNGLVAIGGNLEPDRLLSAYRAGIFPWSSDPVLTWWSPDPRAVFELDSYRPHRSVMRSARRAGWQLAIDRDFVGVMRLCSALTPSRTGTWITEDFIRAYSELHRRGHAHSVEVYEGDQLVGGLYGVTIGAFFGGESMFNLRRDASKVAVAHLVDCLRTSGFTLLDAQMPTPHLMRIGAVAIPRDDYLHRLQGAIRTPTTFRQPDDGA